MDTFFNKLSQKGSAQELIRANSAADTAKMEMMQQQMGEYDKLLQEMRKVNLKTIENMEQLHKVMKESLQKIEAVQPNNDTLEEMKEMLSGPGYAIYMDKQDEIKEELIAEIKRQMEELLEQTNKQQEKIAAEMQKQEEFAAEAKKQQEKFAAETKKQQEELITETKRQMEELLEQTKKQQEELLPDTKKLQEELLPEMKKQIEEAIRQSDDFLHKENVKVYRNVQAAMTEELEKQTETLSAKQTESIKKQKVLLPVSIIIILLVLADIVINLLNITIPL